MTMTLSASDLLWPLLGAVLGTSVLALIVVTLAASAVHVLKPAQRAGLFLVSVLTLWVALVGTGILVRSRNVPTTHQRQEAESTPTRTLPAQVIPSGAISQATQPIPEPTRNVEIFSAPAAAAPTPLPTTSTPQPISNSPTPLAAPARRPSADEWVQYQDLRGIRAERRIRLGDARFIQKGGQYYVDFGKISGLPNELPVVAADQEKVRLWLGE
ncbi:MAG: hypothetical protein J0M24_02935 [Verrucomicrobia bacterium]|nr:hypothetical protein [Verrucomicrobiota bacterium]